MSSLYDLPLPTYETAKALGLKEGTEGRQGAFTHKLMNLPNFNLALRRACAWVTLFDQILQTQSRAENHTQRGPASFVHLLRMEHGSIPSCLQAQQEPSVQQ